MTMQLTLATLVDKLLVTVRSRNAPVDENMFERPGHWRLLLTTKTSTIDIEVLRCDVSMLDVSMRDE